MELALFFQPEGSGGGGHRASGGGGAGGGLFGGGFGSIGMLALMFVLFYFMLIRPQQKRAKEHQSMLGGLKKGDRIVTTGGLVGRISGLSDRLVTLEVAEKVRVQVLRNQIQGIESSEPATEKKD